MSAETREELRERLSKMPKWDEASRLMWRLMLAGDDGSWAGETDAVKVHLYQIAILAEELAKLR